MNIIVIQYRCFEYFWYDSYLPLCSRAFSTLMLVRLYRKSLPYLKNKSNLIIFLKYLIRFCKFGKKYNPEQCMFYQWYHRLYSKRNHGFSWRVGRTYIHVSALVKVSTLPIAKVFTYSKLTDNYYYFANQSIVNKKNWGRPINNYGWT